MQIDISYDYVDIEGARVPRPKHIARSEWMLFWQRIKAIYWRK